jgi:hypothetical protein
MNTEKLLVNCQGDESSAWVAPDELIGFENLLRSLANDACTDGNFERTYCSALVRLGFEPSHEVLRMLASLRLNHVCPLHLDVARALATDAALRKRVRGITLDEFLIDLLGFARVHACLSRRFFTAWRQQSANEERIWWAAENLNRAVDRSRVSPRRLDSVRQLIEAGELAKQSLGETGIAPDSDG